MSDELKLEDVIALFNAIDDLLDEFGMKDERHHAPLSVIHGMNDSFPVEGKGPYRQEDIDRLYRKCALLHAYAKTVKRAAVGIGRAGAGKGAR